MTETKKKQKRDGIVRRGASWSLYLDLGDQQFRRCPACRRRYWMGDGIVQACKRDGTPLEPPRSGRRQQWMSGFASKTDAKAAADEHRTEVRKHAYVVRTKETVAEYFGAWLAAMRRQVRPTTFENYRVNFEAYIRSGIGHVPLQEITATRLNTFYGLLLEGAPWRAGRALSAKSVRNVHGVLSKALGDALDEDKVARNAAKQAKPPKVAKVEMNVWTKEEMKTFLDATVGDRLFALWRLACRTGMRRGELAGLRWLDLDFDAAELSVRQSLVIVGTAATFQPPKTERGKRTIALDQTTIAALKAHRKAQLEERLRWAEAWNDSGLVFVREGGGLIFPELISDWFARAAAAAGLPTIPFHSVRHSYATASLEAGMPVMILSARLGHSTPALTLNVYSHALPATDKIEAARVAEALD